jgi:hypothetical protein
MTHPADVRAGSPFLAAMLGNLFKTPRLASRIFAVWMRERMGGSGAMPTISQVEHEA